MNDKPKDPLARWWWPGQWLHIVYGVWIDQLWYWQNVRPRLHRVKRGWGIFAQGVLGSALITLVVSAIVGGLLLQVGIQVNWGSLFQFAALGFLGGIGVGIVRVIEDGLPTSVPYSVTLCMAIGIMASMSGGISVSYVFGLGSNGANVLIGSFLGIAFGIGRGITRGVMLNVDKDLLWAACACAVAAIFAGFPNGIITVTAFILAFYLAGRWAIRQVADLETRKSLINSDNSKAFDRS